MYRLDLQFEGVDNLTDMFRIGFWADYVDNNGVFRDYWEENYFPSRTNILNIKSFIRAITIF